jgi:hypothetical protein
MVDGIPHEATINQNRRALISLAGYSTGQHVVELTEPPGCFEPITVTCPAGLEKSEDEWVLEAGESFSYEVSSTIRLHDNYPNPFNPITRIRFDLPSGTLVSLTVHDVLGREVATVVNEYLNAGYHHVTFDGSNLASGIYFYRLSVVPTARRDLVPPEGGGQAGSFSDVKKLLLVK